MHQVSQWDPVDARQLTDLRTTALKLRRLCEDARKAAGWLPAADSKAMAEVDEEQQLLGRFQQGVQLLRRCDLYLSAAEDHVEATTTLARQDRTDPGSHHDCSWCAGGRRRCATGGARPNREGAVRGPRHGLGAPKFSDATGYDDAACVRRHVRRQLVEARCAVEISRR
jgi:hypothetical protein